MDMQQECLRDGPLWLRELMGLKQEPSEQHRSSPQSQSVIKSRQKRNLGPSTASGPGGRPESKSIQGVQHRQARDERGERQG